MNKFQYLIIIFSLFLLSITNTHAQNKIVYLDLDYILSNSNPGKLVLQNLKKIENKKIEEFKASEKNLKDEENKILATKTIISNDALEEKISKFQIKLKKYKQYKSNEIDNMKEIRNKEIIKLINSINPIIENFMNENSISIVFDKKNIFIADKNYDITNDIIEKININIK